MRSDFVVVVKDGRVPLRGVTVRVAHIPGDDTSVFTGITDTDGAVQVKNLPPGNYWLEADHLGLDAAGECFRVLERPSRRAKRSLTYDWGDGVFRVRKASGILTDSHMGWEGTVIERARNSVTLPMADVHLFLENGVTRDEYKTTSAADGTFDFGPLPNGTYVLRAEGGHSDRAFSWDRLMLKIDPKGSREALHLRRVHVCGRQELDLH